MNFKDILDFICILRLEKIGIYNLYLLPPRPLPAPDFFYFNTEQRNLVKEQQENNMAAANLKVNDLDSVLGLVHQQAGKFFTNM